MAQIRIKRSTGSTAPSSSDLANAELAFTEGNDILYYGEGTSGSNAASVIKIGGSGAFCDLTSAQTLAGDKTFSNNVTVTGNLTVNGTTTTVSTTNTTLEDNLLELNSGATSNANDCGLLIERGSTGDNAFIGWDESSDKFLLGTTTDTASATGNLTVTTGTLVGNLEGNVTGNVTGNTSGTSGGFTAGNATNLNSGTIPAARIGDDSITEVKLDIHNTPTDGYVLKYSDSNGLIWESAGTATNATNITATANNSTDETTYLTFVDGTTGSQGIETDSGLTYNPSSGVLTTTSVTGNLTGTATTATNVTCTANNSTDETVYLTFVDAATGGQGIETDTGLSYNPSSGVLTVGQIDGGTW